mgnify:CR=1 FL=1
MTARIYQLPKNAMQSGRARTRGWVLEHLPSEARHADPLMGWTSSDDTTSGQVRLSFETKQSAVAYAEAKNIPFQVMEPHAVTPVAKAYSDNFAFRRRKPWTH